MEDNRGPVLTFNVLTFGIVTLAFVALQVGFRVYSRKASASDGLLIVAFVSAALSSVGSIEYLHETVAFRHWLPGLIMLGFVAHSGCLERDS